MSTRAFALPLIGILRREFTGYNVKAFQRDILASITVGAVGESHLLEFGGHHRRAAQAAIVRGVLTLSRLGREVRRIPCCSRAAGAASGLARRTDIG
jgi:hypothetical protein